MQFRYKFNNDTYVGNSIDAIVANIVKDYPEMADKQAILVSRINSSTFVPVATPREIIPRQKKKSGVTLKEAIFGAKAVMKQIVSGSSVSQNEINARAATCSTCQKIDSISGCYTCSFSGGLTTLVNNLKQTFGFGVKIPKSVKNKYCGACECSIAAMIPAQKSDFLSSTINNPERPETCWLKK